MTNVVRLVSGGTIQVRTGVMQGIGPQGPKGVRGPDGPKGAQGPQGETGEMGQILQAMTRVNLDTSIVCAPDVSQLVSFDTVVFDDLGCVSSNTAFVMPDIGDYLFSVWVRFGLGTDGVGDGTRLIRLTSATQGDLALDSRNAVSNDSTYLSLSHPIRTTVSNEILRINVKSSDNVSVNCADGAITIARIGSGAQGVAGPVGPKGAVGATGPAGPQGIPGNASSGFLTYADLL